MHILTFIPKRNIRREHERPLHQRDRLIAKPMDLFLASWISFMHLKGHLRLHQLSLFVAEFIVGIAMALNIKWVPNGIVYVGAACRVQGRSNLGTSHTSPID
jgi:hypothetical protein